MTASLHPQLAADGILLGTLPLSTVLLVKDKRFPWVILVPNRPNCSELIDLERQDRIALLDEIATVSNVMQTLFAPDKLNVAALGNMVPQLHVHIIARHTSDVAWPGPIWGKGIAESYDPVTAADRVSRISSALGISA